MSDPEGTSARNRSAPPPTEIAEWLESLGLGQYAPAFADNDIDRSVLPDLTETDLRDLGVSLGHGKKIMRAIAADRPVGMVHFDAHCDTGDDYLGSKFHHGAPFRRAAPRRASPTSPRRSRPAW